MLNDELRVWYVLLAVSKRTFADMWTRKLSYIMFMWSALPSPLNSRANLVFERRSVAVGHVSLLKAIKASVGLTLSSSAA